AIRERGDLAPVRAAHVLPARVVAHRGAVRLEDRQAVAFVVVDQIALDQEVAGVAGVAAIPRARARATRVGSTATGAGTGADGVLCPAAGRRGLAGGRAGALGNVEDETVALRVAGAFASRRA